MSERDITHHPHYAALVTDDGDWKYTNALANETSPYLLQHAHNPVDWRPWGEPAFEEARQRGVPIFLSIGYATCYWCHVMEREVFEDPAIAEQMNRQFVCIKVDREQRPDVDDLYMTATQVMTRRGGWPMSVFLTPPGAKNADDPGLGPFWCGTYIPPKPMHGMAGFPQVLDGMSSAWQRQRTEVLQQADQVASIVAKHLSDEVAPQPIDPGAIDQAVHAITATYDAEHGGYGDAPKFPTPSTLMLLARYQQRTASQTVDRQLAHTLDRMSRGGLFDQVGGGFHRYSVDERWLVPHFEKMLYDNGQLVELYCQRLSEAEPGDTEPVKRVVRATCDYAIREMTDPTGAFWSAQDAEVAGREGGNYLWTPGQIDEVIDDAALASFAKTLYGLDQGPNFRDPHAPDAQPVNVLYLPRPLAELAQTLGLTLEDVRERHTKINRLLLAARDKRPAPATDDKVLTAWNGMMIAGLARAGAALDEPRYLDAAGRAADAVLQHLATDDGPDGDDGASTGGLYRSYRDGRASVPGFLEDHAHFVHGLVMLHRAMPDNSNYLDHAKRLTQSAIDRFAHPNGGYHDTRADQRDLFVRTRSAYDGATPSGNSQMIHNLIDLAQATGEAHYAQRAARDLESFAQPLGQQGTAMTHMLHALLRLRDHAPRTLRPADQPTPENDDAQAVRVETRPAMVNAQTAQLTLTLTIAQGLQLTAGGVEAPGATTLDLVEPADAELDVAWPKGTPKPAPLADQPIPVYTGSAEVRVTLRFPGDAPEKATLRLGYQPCGERECYLPASNTIHIPLNPA